MAKIKLRPEGDERFLFIIGRHWDALLIWLTGPVLVVAVTGSLFLWRGFGREPDFLGRQPPLLDAVNLILLLIGLVAAALAIYAYIDWANDHLILSNKRVVHEEITPWLAYTYEIIPIDQVQNVNVRIESIFQYLVKSGRIEIQAAGPSSPIVFTRADCPREMQNHILDEVQRQKRSQEQVRLEATVLRRLNPAAAPPPPPPPVVDTPRAYRSPLQILFPISPIVQNGTVIWHRHWIVLLQHLVWPLLAFIVWTLLTIAIPQYHLLSPTSTLIVLGIALLVIIAFFFWQYENWRNDIYILEPSRVVDLERLPFGLYEDRREAPLGVIQNVNARSPNLIARILGYGDVLIETAGATGNFTFDHVPDPDDVQRMVFEYRERFRWQQREREWNNTLNIIDMYYQANNQGNSPSP